jgi:hypothetical protein
VEELENDGFGSRIGGIGAFGEESGHGENGIELRTRDPRRSGR